MDVERQWKNYINGQWQEPTGCDYLESRNPATGEFLAWVPASTVEDARAAADVAQQTWHKGAWAFEPEHRAQALFAWASRLEENQKDIAQLLTADSGKPIREARYEVQRAISYLRFYAGLARSVYGRSTALSDNSYSILAREPVGVVGVIVPWNFPVTLMMRALAPALAAGNAVVVKPAEQTSAVTLACIQELENTGVFPPGILNVISGEGSIVGKELVLDRQVDMISFTGGSETGKEIMKLAARTMKKVSLELGGKSANIIFADANLEKAIPTAISAIFTNAGQLCTVGSRLLVAEEIHDHVIAELKERAESLHVGPGELEKTEMGPLVSEEQLQKVERYAEIGVQDADLITGGKRLLDQQRDKGFFFAPTIFDRAPATSEIIQEEIFGPVLAIQSFQDSEEAVDLANGTNFGLAAGVWTEKGGRALDVARRLKAGTVWINSYNKLAPEVETGGYRESGIGRASGLEGLHDFTEIKHIYFSTD